MALHEFLIFFGAALLLVAMQWRDRKKAALPPPHQQHPCCPFDVHLLTPALERVRRDYSRRRRTHHHEQVGRARLLDCARHTVSALPFFCSQRPEEPKHEPEQTASR